MEERLIKKLISDTEFLLEVDTSKKYIVDDPSDDIFLQTAIFGKADYIISQDNHLLNLEDFQIKILKPSDFLEIFYNK